MNKELKEQVKNYIDNIDGEFYPDDISRDLNINFQKVMEICQELIREGKIEIASWKVETLNKIPKKKLSWIPYLDLKIQLAFMKQKNY